MGYKGMDGWMDTMSDPIRGGAHEAAQTCMQDWILDM
jgi:hypothetical protein